MASRKLRELYDSQYLEGEWSGPRWYQLLSPLIQDRQTIVSRLVPAGSARLLDIGCGEGQLLEMCANRVQELVGVDVLPRRLAIAKKRNKLNIQSGKVKLQVVDADDKLPFAQSYFDVVTCVSVLEYCLDIDAVIDEVARVTQKSGTFILEVPNIAYVVERLHLLMGDLVGVANAPGWQGGRLHHFTESTLIKFVEGHGFKHICTKGSGLFSSARSTWPSLLSSDLVVVFKKE